MAERVDYNRVARDFDRRYHHGEPPGVTRALSRAAKRVHARRVLEVGCGTGHWLRAFGAPTVYGADRALGMLARAVAGRTPTAPRIAGSRPGTPDPSDPESRSRGTSPGPESVALVAADANRLPFRGPRFDLVACIHALHHFADVRGFLADAAGLLRAGGCLLVLGLDPAARRNRWYLYDHFPETVALDLARYPPHAELRRWMRELGLGGVSTRMAQRLSGVYRGDEVFDDPVLHRHGTSQLTLLDDDAFERGMRSIREEVLARGRAAVFLTELGLPVTCGYRPGADGVAVGATSSRLPD